MTVAGVRLSGYLVALDRSHLTPDDLVLAADQFLIKGNSLIAGYPWFDEWGRDTFISLSGLLLVTGRFEEAKAVLTTWADRIQDGMVETSADIVGLAQ